MTKKIVTYILHLSDSFETIHYIGNMKTIKILFLLFFGSMLYSDNHFSVKDIDQIFIMKNEDIIFKLKDDIYFKGDIITPKSCIIKKPYKISFSYKNVINDSFLINHQNGFMTCKFKNLRQIS